MAILVYLQRLVVMKRLKQQLDAKQ